MCFVQYFSLVLLITPQIWHYVFIQSYIYFLLKMFSCTHISFLSPSSLLLLQSIFLVLFYVFPKFILWTFLYWRPEKSDGISPSPIHGSSLWSNVEIVHSSITNYPSWDSCISPSNRGPEIAIFSAQSPKINLQMRMTTVMWSFSVACERW